MQTLKLYIKIAEVDRDRQTVKEGDRERGIVSPLTMCVCMYVFNLDVGVDCKLVLLNLLLQNTNM